MPRKAATTKTAAAKPKAESKAEPKAATNSVRAAVLAARTNDVTPPDLTGAEPHEINSALASPRMQALLKDHREQGGRPKKGG